MKVLDLFSGIGGFSLGLERAGFETVAFCEIDKFCQQVLKKHWPNTPIHEDITKLDGSQYAGTIDLVCAGFPCQPFSVAGKQKGKDDNRYLWPEMFRIIQESKPTWIIGENVPGIINMALEQVCADLEGEGYEVQTLNIPACAVNAPHKRSRIWILAYSKHNGRNGTKEQRGDAENVCRSQEGQNSSKQPERIYTSSFVADAASQRRYGGEYSEHLGAEHKLLQAGGVCSDLAYANSERCEQPHFSALSERAEKCGWEDYARGVGNFWDSEPSICRIHDGLSSDVDRLKSLGNAVVPQIPEIIGRYIMQVEGIHV